MANHFVLPAEDYERKMGIIPQYRNQCAHYMSRMLGISFEEATQFIQDEIKSGRVALKNPVVKYIAKDQVGDRYLEETTLGDYIKKVSVENRIVFPTLTLYTPVEEKESLLGKYIYRNKLKRSGYKNLEKEAEVLGHKELARFNNSAQNGCKFKNNSVSGAQGVASTVVYNVTGHPSLTSGCRILTSSANTANEKLIMGNRHYFQPSIALNNMIAITEKARHLDVAGVIRKYSLHVPSVNEVMDCIRTSTGYYWQDPWLHDHLQVFASKMSPEERAYFVYNADMFHLAKHNDSFMRSFFSSIIEIPGTPHENPVAVIKSSAEDLIGTCNAMWSEHTKGTTLKTLLENNPTGYGLVASAADSIAGVLDHYQDFIKVMLRTDLISPSFAHVPAQYRKAVVTSDTDSTIYTTGWWVNWYTGKNGFCNDSYKIGYTVSFLVNQAIVNTLAIISRNMGINANHIHSLKMKNEFYFPAYVVTALAKHYFAFQSAREGNVFEKFHLEKKGVNLRNAAAAKLINDKLEEFMITILTRITSGEKFTLDNAREFIATVERSVYESILAGNSEFLRTVQTRAAESYTQKENAPAVKQHRLWEEVFSPKYGQAPALPYRTVSLGLTTDTPSKIKAWADSMEDRQLATRITDYCARYDIKSIATIRIPEDIIANTGMMPEIADAAEIRSIVKTIVAPFYIIMTGLGLSILDDKGHYLFSDEWFGEPVIPRKFGYTGGDAELDKAA